MSLLSQERPQQITWVGAAVLGGVLVRGLEGGLPRWWLVLPGTVLWANLHGGWILVPAVLFLVTIGRFLDQGIGDAAGRRFAGLAAAALACGALTPSGLEGLATPLRFAQSTGHIIEWQATEPMTGPGLVTVLMLALVMIGWARPTRAPKSEFFVALILLAFSWTAWRNMVPALLLMAPLVARRLDLAFPSASRRAEPRWSAPLGIGIAVSALVLGLVSVAGREHLPMDEQPIRLAERLKDLGTEERVLNSYGVAGTTLYFGGPRIQVAIDGRADRYSPDYVDSYLDMFDLRGDWRGLLQELAPTSAIIKANTALAHYLVAEAGWVEVAKDGEYLLLREPAAAASPGTPPS